MDTIKTEPLIIADRQFECRLFLGTGKYASGTDMAASLEANTKSMDSLVAMVTRQR